MNDPYGRALKGIRISVNNDCNLKCRYCHREGLPDQNSFMTPDDISKIVKISSIYGVKYVKITGGEPTLRKDLDKIISQIKNIPEIKEISMTTNGTRIGMLAKKLRQSGLDRVNISLPTLNSEIYRKICGVNLLKQVIQGIDKATKYLSPVKVNYVLTTYNYEEFPHMLDFACSHSLILQIIELVDTDSCFSSYNKYFYPIDGIEKYLEKNASRIETRELHARKKYIIDNTQIEVVRSMHNSRFCSNCTRIRLTADGRLKPCLMRNDNLVDILTHIKNDNIDLAERAFIKAVMRRMPFFR